MAKILLEIPDDVENIVVEGFLPVNGVSQFYATLSNIKDNNYYEIIPNREVRFGPAIVKCRHGAIGSATHL